MFQATKSRAMHSILLRLVLALVLATIPLQRAFFLIRGGEGNTPVHDPGWPKGAEPLFNNAARGAWGEGPPFGGGNWHGEFRGDAKAISAFREYLRKAKGVSVEERAEVEGYIKEMEALAMRKQLEAAPKSPPPPPPQLAAPATTPTASPAAVTLTATPEPAAPASESSPFYTRWWFWTIVGGVAVAGAGLAAAGVFTSHKDATCDMGRICQ